MTGDTLRHAARQGKLAFTRAGRRYYTTLAAIEEAFPLCHCQQKAPASIFGSEQEKRLRFVIRDGGREIGMGCLAGKRKEAEKALQEYLRLKAKVALRGR